jgi:hypothetical protein
MYRQMKAIMTLTAVGDSGLTVPMMATMISQMAMARAPQTSSVRRPRRSMLQKEMGVAHTLTRVVTSWMRNGSSMVPSCMKKVVPK